MNKMGYVKHDVTNTIEGVVAHGCNCQGVMGSGVAKAIRAKWPPAYERYREFVEHFRNQGNPTDKLLGLSQIINVGGSVIYGPNTLFVANMFTQDRYGADGKVYADLTAIETALRTTMEFCRGADLPLYMPQVGCGLGGLSWGDDVEPIVTRLQTEHNVAVYVCLL